VGAAKPPYQDDNATMSSFKPSLKDPPASPALPAPSLELREIGREYNEQMLSILRRCPMRGKDIDICFDRHPNIFLTSDLHYDHYQSIGFFQQGHLLGMATVGFEKVYVNQRPEIVYTFTDYYLDPAIRGQKAHYQLASFIDPRAYRNCQLGYAVILQGNKAVEKHIGRRPQQLAHIPFSSLFGEIETSTILLTLRHKESSQRLRLRQANVSDIGAIVTFLREDFRQRFLAPVLTRKQFVLNLQRRPDFNIKNYFLAEYKGELLGVCAAWDTRALKQSRVLRYRGKLKLAKGLLALGAKLWGFAPLPPVGQPFKEINLIEYATKGRDPKIMQALLQRIYEVYRRRQYNSINICTSPNDPLREALQPFYHETLRAHLVLLHPEENRLNELCAQPTALPYLNIALL
jgi:hypothetical protein